MDIPRPARAATITATVLGLALLAAGAAIPGADAAPSPTVSVSSVDTPETAPVRPDRAPDYTFLSSPDFMNCDLADVRKLKTWHRGLPNSWNSAYATTIDTILDSFQAEEPDDVLVAGDLVEGHWGRDDDNTGIFGQTRKPRQRAAAIRRAADFYFSRWRQRFDARKLPVYVAVGDHDIGDNPWRGGEDPRWNRFKRAHLSTFKRALYRKVIAPSHVPNRPHGPAHNTAYAKYLDPEVLLVTVDVFRRGHGTVIPQLDRQQLRWLDRTLAQAERRDTDWLVVQGHVPVIKPVRSTGSSLLYYRGGETSAFWKVMASHDVDLYLNGEVHDISVRREDGITQISHGGTVQMANSDGRGSTNYVLGEVFGDTMWLRDELFVPQSIDFSGELWQVGASHRPVIRKVVREAPRNVGHLVLSSDNELLSSDGLLRPLS